MIKHTFQPEKALEEGEETNVVEFLKLVKPAVDAAPPTGNWLVDMMPGTVFCVRDKKSGSFMCPRFMKGHGDNKSIILFILKDLINPEPFSDVDPNRFINAFDLVKTLGVVPEVQQETEQLDQDPQETSTTETK